MRIRDLTSHAVDEGPVVYDLARAFEGHEDEWPVVVSVETCPGCGESVEVWQLSSAMCDKCGEEVEPDEPMSRSLWPLGGAHSDPAEVAACVEGLPFVVVDTDDTWPGLMLTACGMNLSWEIAAAYVACGLLPPACLELPNMAGPILGSKRKRDLVAGALAKSYRLQARWAQSRARALRHTMRTIHGREG